MAHTFVFHRHVPLKYLSIEMVLDTICTLVCFVLGCLFVVGGGGAGRKSEHLYTTTVQLLSITLSLRACGCSAKYEYPMAVYCWVNLYCIKINKVIVPQVQWQNNS